MKSLTLLRHAKSDWEDEVQRDFDRPLNPRGRKAALLVGREMRRHHLRFDRIIASPAVRVVETLADIADGYGAPIAPAYDQYLYLAPASLLLDRVRATHDSTATLLVVGHNPGIEELALLLTEAEDRCHQDIAVKYPTASLVEIHLPVDRWADVGKGVGTIARFIRPRDLDPELGPL